jgi:hypothetical protein
MTRRGETSRSLGSKPSPLSRRALQRSVLVRVSASELYARLVFEHLGQADECRAAAILSEGDGDVGDSSRFHPWIMPVSLWA